MDVDGAPRGKSRASATPAPPAKNGELVVESQEDLKALTHVRKMMQRQQAWQDPRQKATLLGYFEGDLIVVSGWRWVRGVWDSGLTVGLAVLKMQPQVASLKGKQSQPWDLPWDEKDAAKAAAKAVAA